METTKKEMEMQIATAAYKGSSLPGFQAICPECGLKMTSTIQANLELDVQAHIAYHANKAAK